MKAGFLGGKPTPKASTSVPKPADIQPPVQAPAQSAAAPQPADAPGQPGSADPAPSAASWQQCMELLRSGSDEKKFVGLLLVTKLLPHGTDAALQSVLEAVGWPFLQRMLLPLRQQQQQQQQQQLSDDKLQQQQLSVSLGLSVVSACARLQEFAASEELLQITPLLAKVAAAGGVAPVVKQAETTQPQQRQQQQQWELRDPGVCADRAADLAAAVDALECLVACASSGSYQCSVLLESNGLSTAAAALAAALTAQQQCQRTAASLGSRAADSQQAAAAAAALSAVQSAAGRTVMLSMQLLGLLVEGDAAVRSNMLQAHQTAAAAAVMLLAAVFGGQSAAGPSQQQPAGSTQQQQQQRKQQQGQVVDAAALQLEALHTLLLLLPLPERAVLAQSVLSEAASALATKGTTAAAAQAAAAAAAAAATATVTPQSTPDTTSATSKDLLAKAVAAAGDWPAAVRQGLVQVLRSRVGAVQRHSALQLAAAAVELLGPAWLLPQQQQQQQQGRGAMGTGSRTTSSSSSSGGGGKPEEFLLVLMEVLAIETPLLLSDAVNPGAAVPKADAMAAAEPAAAVAPGGPGTLKDRDDGSGSDVEMEEASGQDAAAAAAQTLSVRQALEQQLKQHEQQGGDQQQPQLQQPGAKDWQGPPGFQQHQGQQQQVKPLRQQLAELRLPEDKPVGQGQQAAGARALQCLPSCYTLLESCLEVLVAQVSILEDLADLSQPEIQHDATAAAAAGSGGAGGGDVVGGRAVSWQEVLPVLGIKEVEQLMTRMGQVTEVVCEFLDYATSPAAAAGEGAAPVDPWLIVGAVRLLGRFLADAPDAHEDAVRELLPRLLLPQGSADATASGSHAAAADGQQQRQQDRETEGEGRGANVLPVSVVSFLLPAMLTWTSKHSSHHQDWASFMLGADTGCVNALAAYLQQTAAAAAGGLGGTGDDTGIDARDAEVQLGSVCQVLYQLLSSCSVLLSARAQQPKQQQGALPALQATQKEALSCALHSLCAWSAVRAREVQASAQLARQQVQASKQPDAVAAADTVLGRLHGAALQLPTLLPAAALAGQLLAVAEVPAGDAAAAAELLCWGCEVGWSVQLLGADQQEAVRGSSSGQASAVLQHMLQVWEVAESEEVWEACLQSTAELLTQHGFGSVFGRGLSAARTDGWLKYAMQGWQESGTEEAPEGGAAASAAAAVVEASVGLQLLLQAVSAVLA